MVDGAPAERERFLVGLIGRSVDSFERGDLDLASAVSDVEATIGALAEASDPGWVSCLRTAWSGLEIIYAVMLDEGRASLTDRDREELAEVVQELRSQLAAPHAPPGGS